MVTRPFLSFFAASCRSSWILDAQGVGTGRSAVQHEKKKKKSREVAVRLAWPAANAEGRQEECADSRRPHRQSVPALGQVPGGQRGLCRRAPRPNSRPAAMAALSGTLSAARMTIFREALRIVSAMLCSPKLLRAQNTDSALPSSKQELLTSRPWSPRHAFAKVSQQLHFVAQDWRWASAQAACECVRMAQRQHAERQRRTEARDVPERRTAVPAPRHQDRSTA
eukprot:TRINITY_DN1809_c0_g1_i12.p1 TRINITY_DN1809_c0_g1~~TRINITY_DN1809_c0_g1_i12.p1  ORF type:complete len:235 (+),score=27.83 TRINITY_DN1809_c0_g1_i12:35-706(+)